MNDQQFLDRHDKMQRLNRSVSEDYGGIGAITSLTLILIGLSFGVGIMLCVKGCSSDPMPTVITGSIACSHCHDVKLNNQARYVKYWKARRAQSHTQLVSAKDEEKENERMVRLITGGK